MVNLDIFSGQSTESKKHLGFQFNENTQNQN